MRSTLTLRTLVLAAVLAGGLALAPPAAAAGERSIQPLEAVSHWLRGFFSWDRLEWLGLGGEAGGMVDPNGARSYVTGDAGSIVDPDGAHAPDTGDAGSMVDTNG